MSTAPEGATHLLPPKEGVRSGPVYYRTPSVHGVARWDGSQWGPCAYLPEAAIPIKRDESVAYIDWSKAPERATHFVISAESRIPSGWYQRDGNKMRDLARELEYTFRLDDLHEGRAIRLVPRPTAWDGQGPPPVGDSCERRFVGVSGSSWFGCIVLARGSRKIFIRDDNGDEWAHSLDEVEFRPYRTPEQIAAEEREEEINRMVALSPMLDKGWARKVCTALYDAGYRKQEAAQ